MSVRRSVCIGVWALLSRAAFGQVAEPPAIEAAEVRINTSGAEKSSGDLTNGRLTLRNLSVRLAIGEAWTMHPDDVYGPSWLDSVRVDIVAKAASAETSDTALRRMLQTLLEQRIGLRTHIEQRRKAVWALMLWKGAPRLTPSEPPAKPEDADCRRSGVRGAGVRLVCRHETMNAFAHELPQYAGGYVTSTVVDKTGLDGAWDLTLYWTPQAQLEGNGGMTLFAALQAQLGLELKMRKLAVPVLVVDRISRSPAPN